MKTVKILILKIILRKENNKEYYCNYSSKPSFCSPLWGNGIRNISPNAEECDDGNNINLDGWSGECLIEKNYIWTQDISGIDIWTSVYSAPIIKSKTFDVTILQITLNFDQTMMQQNVTLLDMQLDATGPNSPYDIKWIAKFDKKDFKISFISTPTLLGGIGEKIRLQLSNVLAFKSEHDINLKIYHRLNQFKIFIIINIRLLFKNFNFCRLSTKLE